MPKILENDAARLVQGLEQMTDAQRAASLDIIKRYKQQQDDDGEPFWPSVERARMERENNLRSMFEAPEKITYDPGPFSQNPQEAKMIHANMALLSARYQKEPAEVASRYDLLINDYARQKLGASEDVDTAKFYALAQKDMQKVKLREDTQREGMSAALRGEDGVKALAAWQAKNADRAKDDAGLFMRGYQQAIEQDGEMLPIADRLLKALESGTDKTGQNVQANMDRGQVRQELGQMVEQLAGMKKAQRKSVYRSLAARIEAAGYDQKGFWSQMLGYLDQQLYRAETTLSETGGIASDVASNFPAMLAEGMTGNRDFGMTPSETAQTDASVARRKGIGNVQQEIMQIVSGELDPVKPVTGWMNETVETGLIKGPGAVAPFMAASALLGPYGAGVVFTADFAAQNRRELVQSGLDDEQAQKIAVMAAPLQAAVESLSNMVSLGKFPAVQAALSRFTRPVGGASLVGRYVQNSLISGATEFTEEQVQDNVVVPAMQELLGALEKDVPEVDWSFYKTRAANATPELAATLLPMALVFGGVMTAADAKLSRTMTQNVDLMMSTGMDQAQAVEVASQPTHEQRIKKGAELWSQRKGTKASMEEAQKKLADQYRTLAADSAAAVKELEARGVLPRLLPMQGGDYRLTFNDGSTADFKTREEALGGIHVYIRDRMQRSTRALRETIDTLTKNLEQGREFALEISPEAMPAEEAVKRGIISPQALQERAEQGAILDATTLIENSVLTGKALGDEEAPLMLYGMSKNEWYDKEGRAIGMQRIKDDILRTTMKLWDGASPLTLIEEKTEGDAKVILSTPGKRQWMLDHLRAYEDASGDKLFTRDDNEQINDKQLIEAWSHMAQSYFVAAKDKVKGRTLGRYLRDIEEAELTAAMQGRASWWQAVVNRAQKLGELKAAGKLGEDVVAELEKQLGIDSQVKHEQGAMQEAQNVANEVAQQVDTSGYSEANPGPNGETFALAPMAMFVTKEQRDYAFGDGRYTHPVTLKNGTRLSGETFDFKWSDTNKMPTFFGYTKNGDEITMQAQYVTPDMVATSRDGNKSANDLRDRLTMWHSKRSRAIPADASKVVQMPDGARLVGPTTFSIAEYRGEHKAPTAEKGASLDDLSNIYPDDIYSLNAARYYGHWGDNRDNAAISVIQSMRGKPNGSVKIYRAVPRYLNAVDETKIKQIKEELASKYRLQALSPHLASDQFFQKQISDLESQLPSEVDAKISDGDWVTTVRSYAEDHGKSALGGSYKIASKTVKAKDLFTNGDSIFEWGYAPNGVGTTFSIRAYHGTPHKVDKFSLAKIGTGEGAQAYGWGLYFAENREVAEGYAVSTVTAAPILWDGEPYNPQNPAHVAGMRLRVSKGDRAAAIAKLEPLNPDAAKILRDGNEAKPREKGNLYTVELLPDESEFLDWDKPLSEQSEKVKAVNEAMQRLTGEKEYFQGIPWERPGSWLYHSFAKAAANVSGKIEDFSQTATTNEASFASQVLAQAGIPGIRYLDGGSRGAGDGTRNFVIFDENLVRILEENGKPVENGETFSIAPSILSVKPPKGVVANKTDALPSWTLPKSEGSVSKVLNSPKVRAEFYAKLDKAIEWLRADPSQITTAKGWVTFMRKAGVWGEIPMPPSGLADIIANPATYVAKLNGGYHGEASLSDTQTSAKQGMDGTVEMRKLIGEGKAPAPFVVALHNMWGILSRMLSPIDQEGMWLRLIAHRPVLDAIQASIDGKFSMTVAQWKQVVQDARASSAVESGPIGNAATSNANDFYLMLSRLNGRWNDMADVYAAPNSREMGRRFWNIGAGKLGIKNKVQRFIGLTFGTPGVIMDRWKFVEFWLPTAMEGMQADQPSTYFDYSANTPSDPVGVYGVYGGIDSENEALSLAMYEAFEVVLEESIAKSQELQDHLGEHANAGGMHWFGWNAIKNEAVGHSSLDLTKELIATFGLDIDAEKVHNTVRNGIYYTEGSPSAGNTVKFVLERGKVRVERTTMAGGLQPGRAGRNTRRAGSRVAEGRTGTIEAIGETFSLRPGDFASRVEAMFSPFQRSPEARLVMARVAKDRALRLGNELIEKANVIRTMGSIDREARVRAALAEDKAVQDYLDGLTPAARQTLEWQPADLQDDPLVAAMLDFGKLMSKTTALQRGKLDLKMGDFDGAPWLPPSFYSKGAGIMPDQMAQAMFDAGLLPDAYTDTLWAELSKRIEATRKDKAAHREAVQAFKDAKKAARDAALKEAGTWADNAKKQAGSGKAQRDRIKAWIKLHDAILAAIPAIIRHEVGSFAQVADYATDEAAMRFLESRVAKMDKVLEKYLVKQARGQLERIFDKARPKSDAGEKAKGKLTPELHAWFKLAEEAAKLSPAVADERIQGIEQSLASDMTDAIKQELSDWLGRPVTDDAEAQTWQETRLTLFQTFGAVMYGTDAKSERNAAEITAALDAAREAYQTGRLAHIEQLAKLREKRAEERGDGIQRVGSPYDPNKANTRKKALNKATGLKGRALDYMDTGLDASGFFLDLLGDDTSTDLYETTRRNLLEAAATKADNMEKRKADFAALLKQVFPGKGLVDRLRGLWELQQIQENAPVGTMSQLQAMQFTLWHLDPDSREWLSINGYGDEWQAKAEQWLTSEAKAVRAWLLKQYDGQYDRLNPVFRRLRGVNLPRVEVYGGKRQIEHSKSDSTASIEADMMRGGMDAGFTKTRVSRPTGRPRMTDALQNYWQNALQVEHYIAFAETVTELKAVFGHRDFLGAVETNRGLAKKQQVLDWISNIETAGTRDAFAHSMQGKLFGRYGKAVSASALLFKLATLAKQAPAAIQSAFKVGLKEYFTSLSRIMAGKGAISLGDMYRSDTVQRRLSEHDSEMLQASKGWNQRHFDNEILDKAAIAPEVMMNAGWYAMGWTDARFTTISAAVAYDVAFRDGKKLGMSDDEAKAFAANQADLIVMETAQPQDVVTKSLSENMMPQALLRLVFAFQSANRQVFGLTYLAAKQGKVANAYAVAALIAGLTQTIGGIMRMMFSDDDPEELFDPQAYALGMATAPLTGMVGLGPLVEFALNFAGVESRFSPSSAAAAKSLQDIVNGEADTKDVGRVVSMAGAALGGRGAMLGVGWNVLNQIMGLYENVTANE